MALKSTGVLIGLQEKHPSALGEFEALAAAASGKQIVMFLDYDGTLSPIVEDPDRAVMTDEVSETERKQSMLCSTLRNSFLTTVIKVLHSVLCLIN